MGDAVSDSAMDAVQRRLMFEDECILVDENDHVVGHDTKYNCVQGKRMGVEANTTKQTPLTIAQEDVEALLEAARYDDIDDVISLASAGISLDSKDSEGRTALHMASANGHLNIVDYLINNRVDVNAYNVEKNTPLHWACLNGHIEVVKSLILAGASVSVLNSHEKTPVDEAVTAGKLDVINTINTAEAQLELTSARVS